MSYAMKVKGVYDWVVGLVSAVRMSVLLVNEAMGIVFILLAAPNY